MKVKSDLKQINTTVVSGRDKMPNPFSDEFPPIEVLIKSPFSKNIENNFIENEEKIKNIDDNDNVLIENEKKSDDEYRDCLSDCSNISDTYTACLKNISISDDEALTDEDEEVPPAVEKNTKQISLATRHRVWDRYFDTTYGTCYVCGDEITLLSFRPNPFEAGHVIARSKGGSNDIKNLRPICRGCNKDMGNRDLRDFQKEFYPNIPKLYPRRRLKL